MITPSDTEYKQTKLIKQGKTPLGPPFDELAKWIASKWNVNVLNIIYDVIRHGPNWVPQPRLQVILEEQSDADKFHKGVNFDPHKQAAIAKKFVEIVESDPAHAFYVKGLFVVFSAFAPLAKEEADQRISEEELKALEARIGNPDLWLISRGFGRVTFFFFTDEQVARYEREGKRPLYSRMYLDVLKPNDEFGYLKESEFQVRFDSKENFDRNFNGSWFNYYR